MFLSIDGTAFPAEEPGVVITPMGHSDYNGDMREGQTGSNAAENGAEVRAVGD